MSDAAASPAPPPAAPLHPFLLGRRPRRTLFRILALVAATAVTFKFVLLPIRVSGNSMEPTYRDGRINFIHRLAYSAERPPRRGDVVAVRTTGTHVLFLKRVIALPGETVGILRNTVIIDGRPLEEPHVAKSKHVWNLPPRRLGPDEFLVIGDNRAMPQEQHAFGVVRAGRIVGRALL